MGDCSIRVFCLYTSINMPHIKCVAVLYGEVPIKFYLYGSHVHMYLHIKQALGKF